MIDLTVFTAVSVRGRMAYALLCAERYVLARYPERDWRPLFRRLWDATSREDIYNWLDYGALLPFDFIEDSQKYGYEAFDISKPEEAFCKGGLLTLEEYNHFVALYEGIKRGEHRDECDAAAILFDNVFEVFGTPMWGDVRRNECFEDLKSICHTLERAGVPLPDPALVAFSRFEQHDGWGDSFDGTKLSQILGR